MRSLLRPVRNIVCAALVLAMLCSPAAAQNFDFSRYQSADLDAIANEALPKDGVNMLPPSRLRIVGSLVSYAEACNTGFLKAAMTMVGVEKSFVEGVSITQCIKVRTAKGKILSLFIQDKVAEFLPKEIPLGSPVTWYALRLFAGKDGPGILVNEFSAGNSAPDKPPAPMVDKSKDKGTDTNAGKATDKRSAQPAATDSGLRGEWHRVGPSFSCNVSSQKEISQEDMKAGVLLYACLHMGPFVIGGPAQSLTAVLGAPHRTFPQPNDATAHLYFLEQAERHPYLVATVQKNKIVALQVTGPEAAKNYSFNHINLGDSTRVLTQYFGTADKVGPSGEKDTDLWSYSPWPFSFEVKDGRVMSIRIADPGDQK